MKDLFSKIDLHELELNAFKLLEERWLAIAAGGKKHHNAMTASWGTVGRLWNKNIAIVFIRPQRYTKGFIEKKERFTLNILPDTAESKAALELIGKKSGRDSDKLAKANLTIKNIGKFPILKEAEFVLACNCLYRGQIEKDNFLHKELRKEVYPEKDYHYAYIGEIIASYKKNS